MTFVIYLHVVNAPITVSNYFIAVPYGKKMLLHLNRIYIRQNNFINSFFIVRSACMMYCNFTTFLLLYDHGEDVRLNNSIDDLHRLLIHDRD